MLTVPAPGRERWSLVALPPASAARPAMLAAVVEGLRDAAVPVLAATYVPGGPRLFDHLYQGNRPRSGGSARRVDSAFLSVHEYDGPAAVLLVGAPVEDLSTLKGPSAAGAAGPRHLRGRFALTTHRMSFLHVPDVPEPVADLLFGCGCHALPTRLAGPDRSGDLVHLAAALRSVLTPTTTWTEVLDRFVRRCVLHAELTTPPGGVCARGAWRADLLRRVAGAVARRGAEGIGVPALASWDLVGQDVHLAADAVELQIVRAWLATEGEPRPGATPAALVGTEVP